MEQQGDALEAGNDVDEGKASTKETPALGFLGLDSLFL